MNRRLGVILMIMTLISPIHVNAGKFGQGDSSGTPGQWYEGLPPSYVDPSKSPIVFIHGLNSSSHTWWQENDMYDTALENGFETAFVDLYPTGDMWNNGKLLADKLEEIYHHFGEKLVIVGHSKGGIDAQSALVHYGASPYVDRIISLSSPHKGSELADLAYSSWAGWLADIIGGKNDATYSLQTGYMDYYRQQTDPHASTPMYTLSGTNWGSFGSSLYWGGLYLSSYGASDGAVTVASSNLPYSTELQVGDWNHSEIRQGSSTFGHFSDYLYETTEDSQAFGTADTVSTNHHLSDSFIRGGHYSGSTQETFYVEENVDKLTINWLSDQKNTTLELASPDGQRWNKFTSKTDETSFFEGSYHHSLTLDNPNSGKWQIKAGSISENYLLAVQYESLLNTALTLELDQGLNISIPTLNHTPYGPDRKTMKSTITMEYYNNGKQTSRKIKWDDLDGTPSRKLSKLGEGVYNLTIDLNGKTKQNKDFNRTIITSVYIDNNGKVLK
ncbi:triacylglycerol lipase [Halobacillus sp. A5]|uniref:esterase/lipase family protein n=1 Tax=Halobacillus sp. A5 TaxID=2880263 RepID=UPI0020A6833E|nr:hypothetical protein [Halobacillus sp. A5]MCP3028043.1 hypothetical protein [Halobacillus sp. A5]